VWEDRAFVLDEEVHVTTEITPATITTVEMEHADGRPAVYVDATGVAVVIYQELDGTYVVDVLTRDDSAVGRLRLLLDGCLMNPAGPSGRPQRPGPPW
jgi:hypothetical protein